MPSGVFRRWDGAPRLRTPERVAAEAIEPLLNACASPDMLGDENPVFVVETDGASVEGCSW